MLVEPTKRADSVSSVMCSACLLARTRGGKHLLGECLEVPAYTEITMYRISSTPFTSPRRTAANPHVSFVFTSLTATLGVRKELTFFLP